MKKFFLFYITNYSVIWLVSIGEDTKMSSLNNLIAEIFNGQTQFTTYKTQPIKTIVIKMIVSYFVT